MLGDSARPAYSTEPGGGFTTTQGAVTTLTAIPHMIAHPLSTSESHGTFA